MKSIFQLKADRPHLRDYLTDRQTPSTDNDFSLLFVALGSALRAHTYGQTDERTDGRYQVHYLPALLKLHGR